jgi:hypothetical protein
MKKICLLLLLALAVGQLHAQESEAVTNRLVRFAINAALFSKNNAQEKVYLHFDNTGYFLGENIWFKAYVVHALSLTPTTMSKVLYVDLLTPEGSPVASKKYPIENGICHGDFNLPDSLPGGFYEVRAYTRCMLNFGKETVFSRVFPVYDKPLREGDFKDRYMTQRQFKVPNYRDKNPVDQKMELQFFPEGGNLVSGLASTVAFKAIDKEGKSVDLTGVVLDANKQVVAQLKTEHNGMGKFRFTPNKGNYTAQVLVGKNTYSFDLPSAKPTGYVLSVTALSQTKGSDSIVVQLNRTSNTPDDTLALAVSCRGKLLDFNTFNIPSKGRTLGYSSAHFPAGICQFTLYDAQGRIRCERLLFVAPTSDNGPAKNVSVNPLNIRFNKGLYQPYEKIKVQLQAADSISIQTGNSISLSIKDASNSNFGNSDNSDITTNLLLSSDLKGYIEDPAWYFKGSDPARRSGLDLLLLTQGWRRYNWEQMDGTQAFQVKHPIEDAQLLDGEVRSIVWKRPVKNVKLEVALHRGDEWKIGKIQTDSLGKFAFTMNDNLYDRWYLDLNSSKDNKPEEYRILLNRQFAPVPKWYSALDNEIWTNNKVSLAGSKEDTLSSPFGEIKYTTKSSNSIYREYRLKDVVKTGKGAIDLDRQIARKASLRYDGPEAVNQLEDKGSSDAYTLNLLLDRLNPYMNLVSAGEYKGKIPIYIGRDVTKPSQAVFQTEKQTADMEHFSEMDFIKKIVRIEVVEDFQTIALIVPDEVLNTLNKPRVLFVIYYNPLIPNEQIGQRKTTYDGYSVSNEFYHPTYHPRIPPVDRDLRRTLYWNPDVVLEASGSTSLEFFNNGSCKKMDVSAEGLTSNGTLLKNK